MKNLAIISFAAALTASMPASAAEKPRISPELTGPYVGVYGAHNWSDLDSSAGDARLRGWEGGVFAGYQLGGVFDWMRGWGIGATSAIEVFYGFSGSDDAGVDKEKDWGISLRPGISFLDRVAEPMGITPYGILGYRNTEFEGSVTGGSGSEWYDGFELGIGTQLMPLRHGSVRLEYSHTWYGGEGGIDPDSNDLRLGVSFRF